MESAANHDIKPEKPNSSTLSKNTTAAKPKSTKPLTTYSKKVILKHMEEHGVDDAWILDKFNLDRSEFSDFVNEIARKSQKNVGEECNDSISFRNIEEWILLLSDKQEKVKPLHEAGYAMKIAELEEHPDPSEMNGVDFEKIYKFLGDTMLGDPTKALDGPNADLVCELLAELIDEVNRDEGDKLAKELIQRIGKNPTIFEPCASQSEYNSLDPFNLDFEVE